MFLRNSSSGLTFAPVPLLYGSSMEDKGQGSLHIESFGSVCGSESGLLAGESPEKQTRGRHTGHSSRSRRDSAQASTETLRYGLRQTVRVHIN